MNKQKSVPLPDRADIVIVGNGIAGLTAALETRRLAPEKSVAIITSQSHPTIHTPALKQFATGKLAREQLLAYPAGTERLRHIRLIHAHVEQIDAQQGSLGLASGQSFGYGALLLATGSRPLGFPPTLPGQDFDGVLTLHNLRDYLDLRRRLPEVDDAVVVGGGPHAIETALALLYWGIRVHWLIRGAGVMTRVLDRTASDLLLESVRKAGVKVYTNTAVLGIVGRVGAVAGVVTTQQQLLPCQLVLACTGTTPTTTLAEHCNLPLRLSQGFLVDDGQRTSARNIYAAGDAAAPRDPFTGAYAPRAQWHAAVLEGRAAAQAMSGTDQSTNLGVPWHATRLGNLSLLSVGQPLFSSQQIEVQSEHRKGCYCRLVLADDRLVGYLSLGATQPDSLAVKRLVDEGLPVREILHDLLRGEFDARAYFSGKNSYRIQRMITTGQLPTPMPLMPGLIPDLPPPRTTENLPRPVTEPLPGSAIRQTDELSYRERERADAQPTLVEADEVPKEDQHPLIGVRKTPGMGIFLPHPPSTFHTNDPTETLNKRYPSRSLWHYTGKQVAIKKERHAEK